MVDSLSLFFGKKYKARRSPGRKPGRGRSVSKLSKSNAYVNVGGRKRKLYRGKNGGLFYRTKSGRNYVPASVLKRKKHMLSPKRRRKGSKKKTSKKKGSKKRKLKMTKKAIAARRAYRKAHPKRVRKSSRFGGRFQTLNQAHGRFNDAAAKRLNALLMSEQEDPISLAANNVYGRGTSMSNTLLDSAVGGFDFTGSN
jgi:hypothetical protein